MAPKILVVDDNQELLTLLTRLFETEGYEVLSAGRGRRAVECAADQRPSVAVLDLLLPDMMGYQVAEALRKQNPALPIIFMTGVFKEGRHALEARAKYGVTAYFEKPFEAQKLIAAVRKIVPPAVDHPRPADSLAAALELELEVDLEDAPQDAMELTGRIKVTGGDNITAELRGANLTAAAAGPSRAATGEPLAPPPPPSEALDEGSQRGVLRDNLPSLITAFYLARENGELVVQRGRMKKVVYFERGHPVFASSNVVSDRFGQFLVRVGKVRQEQLEDALGVAKASGRRTGDVLIERGLLKDTERLFYVGQQVKAIIYSLFGWDEGQYALTFRMASRAESIKLDVHPANLIMRGIKKLYRPDRLKRMLEPEDLLIPSQQPSYALNEVELERWEGELLPHVNGLTPVSALITRARRPDHVVLGFLLGMVALNILEKRPRA